MAARWSTDSSSGSMSSPNSKGSSSSLTKRLGGRRLSQGLTTMNRVAQGLLGKRKSSYKGCPLHGLELCHPCMFRIVLPGATYDDAGKVVPDDKVDAPPAVAVPPAYGKAARFRPLYDRQLRAADKPGGPGDGGGGEDSDEVTQLPARFAEPQPSWFSPCARCGLTYFVGSLGREAAMHHPAHCANAAGERSVAVWVDADPRRDTRGHLTGRYSVYFGRGSRFNVTGDEYDYADAAALEFKALTRALRHAEDVLVLRRAQVARGGISNSHAFLWDLTRFRLLVVSPLKALGRWLQTADAPGDAPADPFDRGGDGDARQTFLNNRQGLDDAVARLAEQGIDVSFFPWRETETYMPQWKAFS